MTKFDEDLIEAYHRLADQAGHKKDAALSALYHIVKLSGIGHDEAYRIARLAENGWEAVPNEVSG